MSVYTFFESLTLEDSEAAASCRHILCPGLALHSLPPTKSTTVLKKNLILRLEQKYLTGESV